MPESNTSPAHDAAPRADLSPERAANLAENPYAGQGSVMLDVGGDIGAIVLYLTQDLEGAEIEISPVDTEDGGEHDHGHDHAQDHAQDHDDSQDHDHDHGHGHGHGHTPHVAVVGRPAGGTILYSAVFPDLRAGTYRLNQAGETPSVEVTVEGGVIAEITWPH